MVKVFPILGGDPIDLSRVTLRVKKRKLKPDPTMMNPQATLKSHLTLPLAVDGEVVGCISLNSDQPNAFDAQDLQFFSVIGYQMTSTLKHFQRFSSVKTMAIYDTLTKVHNRRYFDEKLESETQNSFVNGTPLFSDHRGY